MRCSLAIFCSVLLTGCVAKSQQPLREAEEIICTGNSDQDADGLSDACELALARAFAPVLRVAAGGCNWEGSAVPARPGGGYYFGAQPVGDQVRLIFLPAYYRDCGWSGFKCTIGLLNCSGHAGDSEFIAIDIARAPGSRWQPRALFLSAHCFGRSTRNCTWYDSTALREFEWSGLRPVIWVAAGKHANYPSRAACDAGHWFYDTCDRNDAVVEYPILSERQNIGSRQRPLNQTGCVDARSSGWQSALTTEDAIECLWSDDQPFTGWQKPAVGEATPYGRYLRTIAQF
jgi:hypothetical protein